VPASTTNTASIAVARQCFEQLMTLMNQRIYLSGQTAQGVLQHGGGLSSLWDQHQLRTCCLQQLHQVGASSPAATVVC
jgi:hypothetical protein